MSQIKFGCQFYTWQMSGNRYAGKLPQILNIVRPAGFAGIESEPWMLGSYYDDPSMLKDLLAQFNLQLGAIAFVCNWANPDETEQERSEAERVFSYAKSFPESQLVLVQAPGEDRSNLRQRQENLISCVNAVGARAVDQGLTCSYHPNSPAGSVFRIEADYKLLLDGLDSRVVGFAPDTGHIAKGGMDVVKIFKIYRPLIKHIHFKDITASGGWTGMGAGIIDFPGIVTMLRNSGYAGWIMIEEESPEAEVDPNTATTKNGEYLRRSLLPIV
ncbi:MAG TPA: sugar phosphate isomerase/epimerase [Anaerolineales bacterium]|nr:sugar phosphate isomerase/epimerase [Anaerolineales bacterium]